MLHNYDYQKTQELLSWAQNMLDAKHYPQAPFQLNKSSVIFDCKHYLEAMISAISKHWDNPNFRGTIEHLWEFREKIEDKSNE